MRVSIYEFGKGININSLPPYSSSDIRAFTDEANKAIKKSLNTTKDTLVVSDGYLCAKGIAGIIQLSKDLELEIIPKFLDDKSNYNWKESLFLLSALSKNGTVLSDKYIHSSTDFQNSLYDIAGRALAKEYLNNKRKFIRKYRKERFLEFAIDGEIDFSSSFEQNPEGFLQSKVSFDVSNAYNATIQKAMEIVLPYVKDTVTKQVLSSAIIRFGKQPDVKMQRLSVPSRNREWRSIYNLSYDIVSGMGGSLKSGAILSPSFIVDTWKIWEWLITVTTKLNFESKYKITAQEPFRFIKKRYGTRETVQNVYPDITAYEKNNISRPVFLIDAKYKMLVRESNAVAREDIYESYAFCKATKTRNMFLVYPKSSTSENSDNILIVEDYLIDDITISIIQISLDSLSKQGNLIQACKSAGKNLLQVVDSKI